MRSPITSNYSKSFTQTFQDAAETRKGSGDSLKHVRFKGDKAYAHRKISGLNFIRRWKKQKAGAAVVFKSIENQFGADIAKSVFSRITGSPKSGSGLTFGQLDMMNQLLKTNVSTKGLYAGSTSANLDGNIHQEKYSEAFTSSVEILANAGVKMDMDRYQNIQNGSTKNDDTKNWKLDQSVSDQYVHKDFARDFMGSTFVFMGKPIVDAKDKSVQPDQKRADCIKSLKEAGVPEKDWPVLTATLNQGLFQSHQSSTQMNVKDAPMPFNFGDSGTDDNNLACVKFEFRPSRNEPGVYDFVVTTQKRLANISEFPSDNMPFRAPDVTDPDKSEYLLQIIGRIDCNAIDNPVTVLAGNVAYQAELTGQ